MVNKILKILEENVVLDKDLQKVIKAEYPYKETLASDIDDLFSLCAVGSFLPKVCKGCGSLSTKVIDKKYLACCPDNYYTTMEDYVKNSIYKDVQFKG